MTHATKAVYRWMLSDYVRVFGFSAKTDEDILYTEEDLIRSYKKIISVDYHQEIVLDCGIKFTALNAGHVLGAAMFFIKAGETKIMYTGDYSLESDRHLLGAERPKETPDILISESTYGTQMHQPRETRETMFTGFIDRVVSRGGRCLIPVFAVGRVQELLLVLEEYWEQNPRLQGIPIYYSSSLAQKCMAIYQTYINSMNENIKEKSFKMNPFIFKHIKSISSKKKEKIQDKGPCVMIASPGMLQSGVSREYLESWCGEKKNGLFIPGYVLDGTLANDALSQPMSITGSDGSVLPFNMAVSYISFSAHVDCGQNTEFIEALQPKTLVLVHGEMNEMRRLQGLLERRRPEESIMEIHTPNNCESVIVQIPKSNKYIALGSITKEIVSGGSLSSAIIIERKFERFIIDSKDMSTFFDIGEQTLLEKLTIKSTASFRLVCYHIQLFYGKKRPIIEDFKISIDDVICKYRMDEKKNIYELIWTGGEEADIIAETFIAAIQHAECSISSVRLSEINVREEEEDKEDNIDIVRRFLIAKFDNVERAENEIVVTENNSDVSIKFTDPMEILPKGELEIKVASSLKNFLPLLDLNL
eukprot:GHVP01000193.1.p1 GENE.GHVP01000193.1~~GHVP01000193.1.p1  ORF type:complete len:681 (+),score=130.33 GHVP01000193.1:278-2044(+)